MYCERCNILFEGKVCPACGYKKGRKPVDDDICFLVDKEMMWGEMLADVLKQNEIPFFYKSLLGAGITVKVGNRMERYRFFVPFSHYAQAKDIVESLFPQM